MATVEDKKKAVVAHKKVAGGAPVRLYVKGVVAGFKRYVYKSYCLLVTRLSHFIYICVRIYSYFTINL